MLLGEVVLKQQGMWIIIMISDFISETEPPPKLVRGQRFTLGPLVVYTTDTSLILVFLV
jgi:hypothetical protein